jgi:hypothetical protein
MVIFRRKYFNVFNVLLRACDGPLGGSTSPGFCDGGTAVYCCRIPTKAICLLLAGARAIQSALMMMTTGAVVLVCIFARFKPLPTFEPSAFSPSGKSAFGANDGFVFSHGKLFAVRHGETPHRSAFVHLTRRAFDAAWSASGELVSFPVDAEHLYVATVLCNRRRLRLARVHERGAHDRRRQEGDATPSCGDQGYARACSPPGVFALWPNI